MRILLSAFLLSVTLCSCRQPSKRKTAETTTRSTAIGCMPETTDILWYTSGKKAPLFDGLEGIHFPVTTTNPEALKYFNQGLMLSFGFNHAEAGRSFYEAAKQDPGFAMAWWGFAYVLGPNYNAGMETNNFQRAFVAVQTAKKLSVSASQKEKDLIDALLVRYSNDSSIKRSILDSSYAVAMRNVYKKYNDDVTIATLFAESLLDLHPWNLWTKDGAVQPWTGEIMALLEKCLRLKPADAGANHLYVHAAEMSQHAEMATASADLLRTLVPGSGHLLHMPSHTYIRTGRYHDGMLANQQAVLKDSLYVEACHAQGAYPLSYYPHNYHFIAACATLDGESKIALQGALATSDHAHKKLLRDPAWSTLQHYYAIPWYVEVKLGLWNDVLQSAAPEKDLRYPSVVWHYAQGMAMLSKNNLAVAKQHLSDIQQIMTDTTIKNLTIWGINSVFDLCMIASKTLDGEIRAKENNYAAAIALLTAAVEKEDALNYDEPPDWFFSVRHNLGAVLISAGRYTDAIKIYEADLKNFRDNGWALAGLMTVYEKSGDKKKLAGVKKRFDQAWQYADIKIRTSRIL